MSSEFSLLDAFSGMSLAVKAMILITIISIILLVMWSEKNGDLSNNNTVDHRVKKGPYGDARFATKQELAEQYEIINYNPKQWRKGKNLPKEPGYLLGDWHVKGKVKNKRGIPKYIDKHGHWYGGTVKSYLCTRDTHVLLTASSGAGKTAFFLDPQIEYSLATGISFAVTDTKGDIQRTYGEVARKYYGYNVVLIDLRNPMRSSKFNVINMVNKYTDKYRACEDPNSEEAIQYLARRETYAKIAAKTIITSGTDGNFGQNAFFYDSAEGLLTACILLVSEYATDPAARHIISVYKLIQAISGQEIDEESGEMITGIEAVLNKLPDDSKIKMFAGSAAQGGGESQASVISTAMSRLLSFIDSETEQILCFNSDIDAEEFVQNKTMLVLTMPEEFNTRYFMVSLIIQELYRELLTIADLNQGHVPAVNGFRGKNPRVMLYLDEFGTLPKIDSAEMMFSAARSRGIFFIPIIQGSVQLEKNYGKEGAAIIRDNCQIQMYTGLSPTTNDAEILSKELGTYTARGSSISQSNNSNTLSNKKNRTYNMVSVKLKTPDQIRNMPQGDFIILRTNNHPMQVHFDLFLDWGIPPFKDKSDPNIQSAHQVAYTSREEIVANILNKRGNPAKDFVQKSDFDAAVQNMHEQKAQDQKEYEDAQKQREIEEENRANHISFAGVDEDLEQDPYYDNYG